ncbi:dual oxidase-like isoform X2 [Panonychus citri]|nr:dual oxidase-like isoform X2 [Panonychus citri]XP_053211641.1 dual oxidase-like isoform X2 [Panonychus citri]
MRSFKNGSFKADENNLFPPRNRERAPLNNSPPAHHIKMISPERMFLLGDPRSNQNPALLAFGLLFFRWHNTLASRIQAEYPHWSDEDIFQRARRLVIASLQNIILYEYLPILLGSDEPVTPYSGYKPDVHPGVSHVFQSAAFRFGHTMIPPGLYRRDAQCNFIKTRHGHNGIRLCSTWWGSEEVIPESGFEELLMGLSSQIAEREDSILCSDVRDKLFGPLDFSRRDLAALNIMRGRDNGLPDYNTVRKVFGLPKLNWSEINPIFSANKPDVIRRLYDLYEGDVDNIDLYVGGMLESNPLEGRPGPLFRRIIKEQFERIRDADRFWFENEANGIFSTDEIEEIRKIRFWDILVNATGIPPPAIQKDVFRFQEGDPCPQPGQLNSSQLEPCIILKGWDYFHGSELPYIFVILLLIFIPTTVALIGYGVIKLQNRRRRRLKARQEMAGGKEYDKLYVREWLHQNHKRYVKVKIGPDESLSTVNRKGETLRRIDFINVNSLIVEVTQDSAKPMVLIRSARDHDLVLQFNNLSERKRFLSKLESFLLNRKKTLEIIHTYRDIMLANAETKEKRQKRLEHFFREAYALTFGLKPGEKRKIDSVSNDVIMVMRTSLSKNEFAEALGMKPDSLFVKQMFNCVDKDKDGRISFQEFLDTVVLFSRGKTEDKVRIIFDMCDHDGNGLIDKTELTKMMTSLVDIAKTNSLSEPQVLELIQGMFAASGLQDKEELNYDDFKTMMKEYRGDFIAIGLDCKGAKQNFLDTSTNIARMTSFQISSIPEPEPSWIRKKWNSLITYLEENRQHIIYLIMFFVITFALFFERYFSYSYLTEHTDLRHIMGAGIAITRGSAAALSFCYSLLLLTMCRNLITKVREYAIHQYIPLDSHVQFHKLVAMTGLFFTLVHTIGHCVNFYHISTQPLEHLRCLTKEMHFDSDQRPNFSFWIFGTVTGITGIILFTLVMIIYIFAYPSIRQKAYSYFWTTHSLYVFLYGLSLLHGLAKLTGTPRFWAFFVIPAVLFTLDKVISLQTKYMELDILETELLPSDVTKVKFARPPNFKYLSGQWVRLCCTAFRANEYHSLTLTSAPHENYLSVHVKAHGPWTWKLRGFFDPSNYSPNAPVPKIKLEGPFGGGNQDWYKHEIAIMVGGGIGVTPYASILNDLVFGTSTNRYSGVACKKVYFLWICASHRHFEWFIDVLRDVESKDVTNVLEVHIFITQFFHKFDLRTTMLYICENHFQRISNRSMFTGLKAINHFRRPDMNAFLKFIRKQHSYVSKVGVFSCGPTALTQTISAACESVNKQRKLPYFLHQFENFNRQFNLTNN